MRLHPAFFDSGESGLLVDFGTPDDRQQSLSILQISKALQASVLPGLKEIIPALSSLTILYDPFTLSRSRLVEEILRCCERSSEFVPSARHWDVPVIYGGEGGPDLKDVAMCAGMSEEEVIALHAGRSYHVYMLGFLPGFAYLGDLPKELQLPRRATPRARVPAGSVAIASAMTAIYPLESPGGWHIIGHTPVNPWDLHRRKEPLFQAGDQVSFTPVTPENAAQIDGIAKRFDLTDGTAS